MFIKRPPVVGEPPCGTIVEQRMRGRVGDPVRHLMKGDPSGKQLRANGVSLRTAEALRTASLYVHEQSHIEGTQALSDPPPVAGSQWPVLKCHPGADVWGFQVTGKQNLQSETDKRRLPSPLTSHPS